MGDITGPDVQAHPGSCCILSNTAINYFSSSDQILMLYQRCYKALIQANVGIAKIPGIEMDETLKARYMGELYFIRGFWMFRLGICLALLRLLLRRWT
jgi:hypothetical protein